MPFFYVLSDYPNWIVELSYLGRGYSYLWSIFLHLRHFTFAFKNIYEILTYANSESEISKFSFRLQLRNP